MLNRVLNACTFLGVSTIPADASWTVEALLTAVREDPTEPSRSAKVNTMGRQHGTLWPRKPVKHGCLDDAYLIVLAAMIKPCNKHMTHSTDVVNIVQHNKISQTTNLQPGPASAESVQCVPGLSSSLQLTVCCLTAASCICIAAVASIGLSWGLFHELSSIFVTSTAAYKAFGWLQ